MRPEGAPFRNLGAGGGEITGPHAAPMATTSSSGGDQSPAVGWEGLEALLLDQVEAAVTATDLDGRIIHWNRHAEVLFGWTAAEAVGCHFQDLLASASTRDAAESLRTMVLEGRSWEGEFPIPKKDGTPLVSYTTLAPLRDVGGVIGGMVSVSVDISERSRQERLVAARTAVTRVLAEASDLLDASRQIIDAVCEHLEWEVGACWQVAESAGVLRCVHVSHRAGGEATTFEDLTRMTEFLPGIGLPGRVWMTAEPAWIPDLGLDDNFPRAPGAIAEGLHSAFGFPISRGSTVLGVLEFFSREIRQPDELLLSTMSVIGSQIGQFIERIQAEAALRESEARNRAILEAALDCVITMDARGRVVEFNPAAERTFGYRREEAVGQVMADLIIPPSFRGQHTEGLARYLATGEGTILGHRIELTGLRADGTEFPVEVTITRVDVPGEPLFTGYLRDITERKRVQEELVQGRERLRLALEAGKLGTWHWDMASGGVTWDQTLEAIYGFEPRTFPGTYEAYVDRIHPDDRDWVRETVRHSVETATGHQFEHRVVWPDGTVRWVEGRGRVVHDEAGNVLGMVGITADITERKREEDTQRFLAEAGTVLAASLDFETTLRQIARLAVAPVGGSNVADWCAVHLRDAGGTVRVLAVEHTDPEKVEMAAELQRRYPPDPDAPQGVHEVIRTGRPEIYPDITDEMLVAGARDDEHLASLRGLGFRSAMVVPLSVGGRTIGAVTLVSAESARQYGPDDLTFAEELARRAAFAVENARLFEAKKEMAQQLQAGFLPPELPDIPGVELAGRYRWGGAGEVGGDFYDAFATGDGAWAVLIGDVCGKGPEAAVVTALARYTLRAVAMQSTKPSAVLGTLNDAVRHQRSDRTFCTVCYARLRVRERGARLTVCCAGHPLPIVLRADGTVEDAGAPGTLLGIFSDPDLTDRAVDLGPGDALVMYTDGVIEERAPGAVFGRERLGAVIRSAAGGDAGAIAEAIERAVLSFRPDPNRDDIAILVVRVKP
jgi:PAS domain S-box-containing protein